MAERFAHYVIADVYKSSTSEEKETFVFGYYDSWAWGWRATERVGRVIQYAHGLEKKNFKLSVSLEPKKAMDLLVISAMGLSPTCLVDSITSVTYSYKDSKIKMAIEGPNYIDNNNGYSIIDLRDLDKIRVGFYLGTETDPVPLEEFVKQDFKDKPINLHKVYSSKYVLQNMTKDDMANCIEICNRMNIQKKEYLRTKKEVSLIL